jgi:hypothetical protein
MRTAANGVAASLLLALASVLALASPAPASTGSCDGVWVVVDARAAGGSLSIRCAKGDPSSGLAALERAGFSYAFTPRIPGFVCTIDARPDPCNGAPADAYWSYWHAEAGGSWTYATAGAGSRDPAPGSVEGWRFGDGSTPPGTAPPANAPAPKPEPKPEPEAPSKRTEDTTTARANGTGGDPARDTGGGASASTAGDPGSAGSTTDPSSRGATGAAAGSSDRSDAGGAGSRAAMDRDGEDPAEPEDASSGPSWDPPDVATGEWANPPRVDAATTAPSAAASPEVSRAPEVDTPQDVEEEMALATRRSTPPPASPVGAFMALGLLGGLGALTWRHHVRRSGSRS